MLQLDEHFTPQKIRQREKKAIRQLQDYLIQVKKSKNVEMNLRQIENNRNWQARLRQHERKIIQKKQKQLLEIKQLQTIQQQKLKKQIEKIKHQKQLQKAKIQTEKQYHLRQTRKLADTQKTEIKQKTQQQLKKMKNATQQQIKKKQYEIFQLRKQLMKQRDIIVKQLKQQHRKRQQGKTWMQKAANFGKSISVAWKNFFGIDALSRIAKTIFVTNLPIATKRFVLSSVMQSALSAVPGGGIVWGIFSKFIQFLLGNDLNYRLPTFSDHLRMNGMQAVSDLPTFAVATAAGATLDYFGMLPNQKYQVSNPTGNQPQITKALVQFATKQLQYNYGTTSVQQFNELLNKQNKKYDELNKGQGFSQLLHNAIDYNPAVFPTTTQKTMGIPKPLQTGAQTTAVIRHWFGQGQKNKAMHQYAHQRDIQLFKQQRQDWKKQQKKQNLSTAMTQFNYAQKAIQRKGKINPQLKKWTNIYDQKQINADILNEMKKNNYTTYNQTHIGKKHPQKEIQYLAYFPDQYQDKYGFKTTNMTQRMQKPNIGKQYIVKETKKQVLQKKQYPQFSMIVGKEKKTEVPTTQTVRKYYLDRHQPDLVQLFLM